MLEIEFWSFQRLKISQELGNSADKNEEDSEIDLIHLICKIIIFLNET